MGHRQLAAALVAASLVVSAAPAAATFHNMRIVQVYAGDVTHPEAQYVVLQMCTAGQNLLGGHGVGFFDSDGAAIGSPVVFPGSVANAASQARVLVATSSAEALFGLTANLRMPARISPAGGKLCFDESPVDCFGWGNYNVADPTTGTPYDTAIGLPPGSAVQRDLSIDGGTSTLDCTVDMDDTDDSAADFDPTTPNPGNNAGATGVVDPDHVFFHSFENGTGSGWSVEVP
ncbi:MAG: hypothetical protein KBF21_12425 [Thermoanaerobaculia bacterium]|nr:hypothetical protein [Thermoanaerobaculia bacterium]MBP9825022.1 hypothetical protein [Thermoanaerobaculia bacterium]